MADAHTSIYNVLDYGATGDGVHEDSQGINTAINESVKPPGGGIVYVPHGTFRLNAEVTVPAGCHLIIDGVLHLTDSSLTALRITGDDVLIEGKGQLMGSSDPGASDTGIGNVAGARNNLVARGLSISNFGRWPFNFVQSSNVTVENLVISDCGAPAEFAEGSNNCWARRLLISNSGDSGFAFYGGVSDSGITDSTITGSRYAGIVIESDGAQRAFCNNITVANNICHGNRANGIWVFVNTGSDTTAQGHQNITITGNETYDNGSNAGGVVVQGGICVLIAANNIHNETSYGIKLVGVFPMDPPSSLPWISAHVVISANNIFAVGTQDAPGVGILFTQMYDSTFPYHGHDISILANRISGTTGGSTMRYAIASTPSTNNECNNVAIQGNYFDHWTGSSACDYNAGTDNHLNYNNVPVTSAAASVRKPRSRSSKESSHRSVPTRSSPLPADEPAGRRRRRTQST